MRFTVNDIVVRLHKEHVYMIKGDISSVIDTRSDGYIKLYDYLGKGKALHDSNKFRLATPEEAYAYSHGCTNIADLDKYTKKEIEYEIY